MKILITLLILTSLAIQTPQLYSQKKDDKQQEKKELLSSQTLNGLKLRSIGPALASGRIVDIAVHPSQPEVFYIAVACGNIWKTTNYGIKWIPVFDNYGSFSIGCLAIDPKNPHAVWAGTGENNSQRSVSYGDGVYKTLDGGKTWKNMGLKNSEHIGKIIIDPENSDIIYVAAQGPLWGPGGDRGLYKSSDGGKNWEKSLFISENTGISDIVMDPKDNKVIYASSYQRRRHVWTLINGGPEGAIYKTNDAGKNWEKLTSGLPSGFVGRIGLAIPPSNPDIIYALIEAEGDKGGFFCSTDRGASWEKRNPYKTVSAQYYQEIMCDPHNADKIYSMDTYTQLSTDGGRTWRNLGNKERHVDDHALWIDPKNTEHLLIGGDGGLYESWDGGKLWRFFENLPITQFYRVGVDNAEPFYNVYGGTQDNATIGGPSRTLNYGGIMNQDWYFTKEGDGFQSRIDPTNPDVVYSQAQYGSLVRYDKKSGEQVDIQPQEEKGEELRWNWDSPLIISPHSSTRLYFAANKLFRSDDRGNSWKKISGDLSRQIDRNQLEVMGRIWEPEAVAKNASTSLYGNIVSLNESAKKENLIYIGTDDGLIQITEDAGQNWRKVDKFPGVPDRTYVSDILTSQHDESTVYACFDNHKMADFKPYILKSTDKGSSWVSISSNLPENGAVYTIVEDHINKDLLFAGTEFGVFASIDGGKKWTQLKGNLPTNAVRDLEIQKRENDLVLATFGRSFYILDDYSALRELNKEVLEKEAHLFSIRDGLMYVPNASVTGRRNYGEEFYMGDNPDFGVFFTYYIKEAYKTKKDKRIDSSKVIREKGQTPPYPGFDDLRAEDLEESPFLLFIVKDSKGNTVRKLKSAVKTGINRISWDLRHADTEPITEKTDINKQSGMPALPGKYSVELHKSIDGDLINIAGPIQFNLKTLQNRTFVAANQVELDKFYSDLQEMQRVSIAVRNYYNDLKSRLALLRQTLLVAPGATNEMKENARKLVLDLEEIKLIIFGDESKSERNENQSPALLDRLYRMFYYTWRNMQEPPSTYKTNMEIAGRDLDQVLNKMQLLMDNGIKPLENEMDRINAPWTPGRVPQMRR